MMKRMPVAQITRTVFRNRAAFSQPQVLAKVVSNVKVEIFTGLSFIVDLGLRLRGIIRKHKLLNSPHWPESKTSNMVR